MLPGVDHQELTAEMALLSKLPMPDRLRQARKRRCQQLKEYAAYERQISVDSVGKSKTKKRGGPFTKGQGDVGGRKRGEKLDLQFADSILLLDAVRRNDIPEGLSNSLRYIQMKTEYHLVHKTMFK